MQIIDEIEISYFRSFYKIKIQNIKDLNIIFGKNDSGKSNVVRALSLFFSGRPEHSYPFEFPIDFSEQRLNESENSEDVRKFLYVKVTFNTPHSYKPSLGEKFYVKRQWTVSRGQNYHEEISKSIPDNRRHIVARLLNKIRFMYVPAIKDVGIFEMLLAEIHETVANSEKFVGAVQDFTSKMREQTSELFSSLPKEVSASTKIGAPTQLGQLFRTLEFETISENAVKPKSLIRQRGDGIKARHIPELLNFISKNDRYEYHIWGFEEPENSLDFVASQSEAKRILEISKSVHVQVFLTTHSPSFYLLDDKSIEKFYVSKNDDDKSIVLQSKELKSFDVNSALSEGFYLPAVAELLDGLAKKEAETQSILEQNDNLIKKINEISTPSIIVEGRTDVAILKTAWSKIRDFDMPFCIMSSDTVGDIQKGGNGGASNLSVRLKGIPADHHKIVIGLFDYDDEGIKNYKLDRNFKEKSIDNFYFKSSLNNKCYAIMLPIPDFRRGCEETENMPIEFMFEDEFLYQKVDQKGLSLMVKKYTQSFGRKKFEFELEDLTQNKTIIGGKKDFSEIVVPTFPKNAFSSFETLFSMIEKLIVYASEQGDSP